MEKIIGLLLLLAVPAFSAPSDSVFKEANALYTEGKFSEALQKYDAIPDAGSSWVLEFNKGNTAYRLGQLGNAVLHYERAFRLRSNQKDVIYNLALASARAGDPRLPESGLVALAWKLYYMLTLNQLTVLATLLLTGLALYGGLLLAGRAGMAREIGWGLAGASVLIGLWVGARIYEVEHPRGVVVAPIAEVRSGPSITYPANFTVPEGHRVLILDTQEAIQGWLQIGIPREGLRGWVPEQSVQVI